MTPEKIESFQLAAGLTVRIGYPDAHVEISYKAHRLIPAATFTVAADELEAVPGIFAKAIAWAQKVKEAKP